MIVGAIAAALVAALGTVGAGYVTWLAIGWTIDAVTTERTPARNAVGRGLCAASAAAITLGCAALTWAAIAAI